MTDEDVTIANVPDVPVGDEEAAIEAELDRADDAIEEIEEIEAVVEEVEGDEVQDLTLDESVDEDIVEEAIEETLEGGLDDDEIEAAVEEEAIVEEVIAADAEAELAIEEAVLEEAVLEVLDEDDILEEEPPPPPVESPYDRPGKWFVLHTQSGYENKVRQNIEARRGSMNMESKIHEVVIPMEDVVEFKQGKKVVVQKKMFPGYLLVRCSLDDDSWYVIRNTPGVTGFVGAGNKPPAAAPQGRRELPAGQGRDHGGRPQAHPSPARVRDQRDRAGQGRPVRGLLRRDRRDQRGPAQAQGAGQHLRA